ncbi:MAG: ATP-dependent DNA helicase RecG [Clostridia bacterium]
MTDISDLKGIGPVKVKGLNSLGIFTVKHLLEYYPRTYADRSIISDISSLSISDSVSLKGIIFNITHKKNRYGKRLYITTASLKDETGQIDITWYNQSYLQNILFENKIIYVYGKIERRGFFFHMTNPSFSYKKDDFLIILPIYAKNAGTTQKDIRIGVRSALSSYAFDEKDIFSDDLRQKYDLCTKDFAIRNIHYPNSNDAFFTARRRLVFEELFLLQMSLFSIRSKIRSVKTAIHMYKSDLMNKFIDSLPYKLTDAQNKVINEINEDMKKDIPMNRLLQGDVGSGKTVVAMAAMVSAFENSYQSAFMAPTEILANQHYINMSRFFEKFGIRIGYLTGKIKGKNRERLIQEISAGNIDIIIGTHALIEDDVVFKNLGLCITDEQHRFGVAQRKLLSSKGDLPHVLVMSATPIPRTLALILYGDLDVSVLDEMPPDRKKIKTFCVDESYRTRITEFIRKTASQGEQVYVVCPSIIENDDLDITNVQDKYNELVSQLPELKIDMLHGKMKNADKIDIMESFACKNTQVLVSTSIIEVGINVADATVMIIEDAQQFGLSQIHQLRGRVGRSDKQSYCVLFNQSSSDISKQRMKVLTESNDGFKIAEQDLILRGPGEFFGSKQHGIPELKISNLYTDIPILKSAQKATYEEIEKGNYYTEYITSGIDNLMSATL